MKRAHLLVMLKLKKRHDAFREGLEKIGFEVSMEAPGGGDQRGNVMVLWNRRGEDHQRACRFEMNGGTVLVAENGYLATNSAGHRMYALAKGGHNGIGTWYIGQHQRAPMLDIKLQPWRKEGRNILVCPSRGMGQPQYAMPMGWVQNTVGRLTKLTKRPIRIRYHPGEESNPKHKDVLEDDFKDVWCVVIWASGVGVKALVHGLPVIYTCPIWIGSEAAGNALETIEAPVMGDREAMLERLAWAQWSVEEIRTGQPFRFLLERI